MASSAANRATFTSSLISFMDTYGFDGVDIDWEYPVAEDRGGKPEDKANYVTLCQELKAAFNGKYGKRLHVSVTTASGLQVSPIRA